MTIREVQGLNGGRKQLWLRQHEAEVRGFFYLHGRQATMTQFNMTDSTLDRFLLPRKQSAETMSKADRALAISQSAIDMSREATRRVSEVERQLKLTKPYLEVLLTLGLMMRMVASLPSLDDVGNDDLAIGDFNGKSRN